MNVNEANKSSSINNVSKELAAIYINTFSQVGSEFLDSLMREMVVQTKSQSALLLQLLSPEEYKELSIIYKQGETNEFHVASRVGDNGDGSGAGGSATCDSNTATSSPESQYSPEDDSPSQQQIQQQTEQQARQRQQQDHLLLIRSCFTNQTNSLIKKNTVIPLSQLSPNSPYLKTLFNKDNITLLNDAYEGGEDEEIYPKLQPYFIGTRLVEEYNRNGETTTKGMICIMDNKPILEEEPLARVEMMTTILKTVKPRCINELNELHKMEQLLSARDYAMLDAENKLKFLADMSHEIRTPMNAVIALTDLLLQERSSLNIEQIEHLEVIQTSGSHLLTIINDILDISKLNHDPKFKLENRRFSLRKCLKDTLNMARHQASMSQQNKVVYVLECPPDKDNNLPLPQLISQLENNGVLLRPLLHKKGKTVLPLIWKIDSDVPDHLLGDTMRLTQIMLNLCSNAVKFTKQGGIHIRIKRSMPTPLRSTPTTTTQSEKRMTFKERYDAKIETMWNRAMQDKKDRISSNNPLSPSTSAALATSASDDTTDSNFDYFAEKSILEISVTDTGIGIPADRLPKLFKSFSQIDISTARRYGGTGLGLAISSTLVNRMGGCVWVESEESVGSRFALTLPMTMAPRGRNYSNDSTPLGFAVGSPSSPSSTISDSSSSVHSALGSGGGNANLGVGEVASPISSMYNTTFATPAINNTPGYFPPTNLNYSSSPSPSPSPPQQQQQYQQMYSRPLLPRTTNQYIHTAEPYIRSVDSTAINTSTNQGPGSDMFSPMAEDTQSANSTSNIDHYSSSVAESSCNNNNGNTNTSSNRKAYNDLLSPATRNTRVAITKQHYNRKPPVKEENLAKLHPLRILLAEDNILNQKIAISILKRLGYVDVAIANNGSEVLTLMKLSVFDVIFMDLYMPEMDGLEVTREIIKERERSKERKRTKEREQIDTPAVDNNSDNIMLEKTGKTVATAASNSDNLLLNALDVYIIALTASASSEDRDICIEAGMNDFISKPFTMNEMKGALKTCANKRKKRRKLAQKEDQTASEATAINVDNNTFTKDDPMLDVETVSDIVTSSHT